MTSNEPISVLGIYRGRIDENRGTPIRVRSFLERLAKNPDFSLTVASWDDRLPFDAAHVHLTNKKLDDLRALKYVVREKHIRIVMGHTMATWYYLLALKFFAHVKIALEMHGFLEVEARFYGSIGVLRYWFERSVYACFYPLCDLITTCSDNAADILKRYNQNVVPIYGGVDTNVFRPDVAPLSSVVHEPGTTLIGYAGNTRKWQGVPFLIDAFKKLHEKDSSFRLALLSSEAKNIPSGSGISTYEQVPHDQVPAFLAACDVLVIPRLADAVSDISFPSKLPEYLAMGKPVIASATSDAHRVIESGVDGIIFPPGDEEAFIRALESLKEETLRKHLGTAARASALERFQWDGQTAVLAKQLRKLA